MEYTKIDFPEGFILKIPIVGEVWIISGTKKNCVKNCLLAHMKIPNLPVVNGLVDRLSITYFFLRGRGAMFCSKFSQRIGFC